jgi:hypothetical protein
MPFSSINRLPKYREFRTKIKFKLPKILKCLAFRRLLNSLMYYRGFSYRNIINKDDTSYKFDLCLNLLPASTRHCII